MGTDSDTKQIPAAAPSLTELASAESHRLALLPALVLFAITILCNLPLLNNTPLAGTEGHRAITAEQMVREGNWILPKLFDRYYLAKPPMQYWLISLSHFVIGGWNGVVWRCPAIIAAGLLNATLCLFAGRWFGRTAAWVAGWSGFGLIALWGQIPSADVDSADTLFAILAALAMVEMLFAKPRSLSGWTLLAGVSTGAMLLTKGPAGMLPIAGALMWGVVALALRKRSQTLIPPDRIGMRWAGTIATMLIGVSIFGGWIWLAYWKLHHGSLPADYQGVQEGTNRLKPNLHRFLLALAVPPQLFLFTLPISIVLLMLPITGTPFIAGGPSPGLPADRRETDSRRIANALAGSVLLSWLVALITGTENPRWVYTTLPLLCPLAGAVVAGALRLPARRRGRAMGIFSASILLYAVAAAVFSFLVQHDFPADHAEHKFCWIMTVLATAAAVIACADFSADRLSRAGSMAAITLVLATVPFTIFNRFDRARRSGIGAAPQLADIIGPGGVIGAGRMTISQPELFYYAGANVRRFANSGPSSSPGFMHGWVIAFPDELKAWRRQGTINDVHPLKSAKMDTVYIGWFDAHK
jgi:4-amino-4-deoxy-L-arabinose transferase-like glycosyltransferase